MSVSDELTFDMVDMSGNPPLYSTVIDYDIHVLTQCVSIHLPNRMYATNSGTRTTEIR